ncbi:MAG TPA: flagellar hook-basal body complex protein FliE [Clostridia bacterium]|nr:flagellar hook-basal body complex protein FliE [Clostridia bacterium]
MNTISAVRVPTEIQAPTADRTNTAGKASGFMSTLEGAMQDIERLQSSAQDKVTALLDGSGQDVHSAMIAVEQADLSFQLMMQVRNKIVNAYQEVSRMQF